MKFRDEIAESLTLKFAEAANERRQSGKDIISLGLGEPDFKTPKELVDATVNVLQNKKSGYSSPLGLFPLRSKIAKQLSELDGIPSEAGNIIVTPGAKQSMQLALMALLEPEDEVIIINPSFVSFIPQVYIAEPESVVKIVDLNKSDFSLNKSDLVQVISEKTKVLIINSPSNPTGTIFSNQEIAWIYAQAEKYNFYIISDEVYKRLSFSKDPILSIGSLEKSVNRVFTINGYSKSHAITGWRFGFMSFPILFTTKLLKLQQHINTNTCTFIQEGILNSFEMDMSFLKAYNEVLTQRIRVVEDHLSKTNLKLTRPESGFFAFIDITSTGLDSNTFCSLLIKEEGVATTPGIAFGQNWDGFIRLSYAVTDEVLNIGMKRLVEFSKRKES